jgi:peptidoglycan/LPS O-acetylase OafA/YrhL
VSVVAREHLVGSPAGPWNLPRSTSHVRRFGLDAMRATAILLVLLSHALIFSGPLVEKIGLDPNRLFWITGIDGVELFFCLSGFLIGRLLLDIEQRGASADAIRIFLVRRWMRTLPLYYLVLFALLFVPQLDPAERQRTWSYLLLIQNVVTPMPQPGWFGPSWSLTIEEWSYVALPLIAFCACRWARRPVFVAALILIVAGIAARLAIGLTHGGGTLVEWDSLIRKMAIARCDAVAYGVLAAVFVQSRGALRWKYHLLLAGLALGVAGIWIAASPVELLPGPFGWLVLFPLRGLAFALIVPWLSELPTPRLLAAPVRFVAHISYCLYLVHWPFLFIAISTPEPFRLAVFIAGSFAVATVLSYAVEYPIMRLRPRQV